LTVEPAESAADHKKSGHNTKLKMLEKNILPFGSSGLKPLSTFIKFLSAAGSKLDRRRFGYLLLSSTQTAAG